MSAAVPAAPRRRVAVVDVGSNSLHLQLVELPAQGPGITLAVRRAQVTLGQLVDGRVQPARVEAAARALSDFAELAQREGCEPPVALATAGLRLASDGLEVASTLSALSGVPVRVISGQEEARLVYLGVRAGSSLPGRTLVIDLGGRSTELAIGDGPEPEFTHSINVGHLWAQQVFARSGAEVLHQQTLELLAPALEQLPELPLSQRVVTSGTALTWLAMAHRARGGAPLNERHGLRAELPELRQVLKDWRARDVPGRRGTPGFDPRRTHTFEAGALAMQAVLGGLPGAHVPLISSQAALREGLIEQLRTTGWPNP